MALKMQDGRPEAEVSDESVEEVTVVKKKKLPIPLIAGLIVLLAVAGVGAKIYLSKRHPSKPAPVVLKVGETVPLDEFMMNLADDGDAHYIKTTLVLGLKEGITADKFKDKVPQVRDAIVLVLSAKKLADIATVPQKIALKNELKDAINQSLGETDVVAIYYQEFATQ